MQKAEKISSTTSVRAAVCALLTVAIFAAFAIRLFSWQIIRADSYQDDALSSASYTMTTDASRGEILDRNGKELVINDAGYMIIFNKLYMKEGTENEVINKLIHLMAIRHEEWVDALPIVIDEKGEYRYKPDCEATIEFIKSKSMLDMNRYATAADCMAAFEDRFDLTDSEYTDQEKRDIISVRYNMEFKGYSNSTPYRFAENISRDMIAIVMENSQGFPGVECAGSFVRFYKEGALLPHVIGSVGAISQEEYDELKDKGYTLDDTIGKSGIEAAMEQYLKGVSGEKRVTKTSDGAIVDEVETVKAVPGNTVYLTIDAKLQDATNRALAQNVKEAAKTHSDCVAGAAVMIDLDDFSVLASSTYPTFDQQKYMTDEKYYNNLVGDATLPLFDRALTGNFIIGSTFKPCVAAAALEEGVVTSSTQIFCKQNYDYYKSDIIRCMGYHSNETVEDALRDSCNYYFAEVGRQLGIKTMDFYAEKFGLGVSTGIELYESRGILAGRDSETWYEGNTCQAAIGQSDNAFTPIQLATYAATIANDGVRLRTHFVDKVTDYTKKETILDNSAQPEVVETAGVSTENMRIVKEGMRKVVTSGTAKDYFSTYKVKVAGKTGTAENIGTDNVTFIAFAPYDNPKVALAVVIEHGGEGKYSMGTAKAMLDAYFGFDKKTSSKTSSNASSNTSSKIAEQ